jgi:competence protein ComEA
VVPSLSGGTAVAGVSQSPLVNINTATQTELEDLPGIGEVRAGAIIQSRTVDGPFGAVEDLLSREIVPESVFQDIAPLISVY